MWRNVGRTRLAAALLASNLAGCALIDPHQHASDHQVAYAETSQPGDLGAALNAAYDQKHNYEAAVREYSIAANAGPIAIGGVALSALFLGTIGGASPDLRWTLAGVGTGLFGLDRAYDSPTRQQIWLNGIDALTCAIAASEPLMAGVVPSFDLDVDNVRTSFRALNAARVVAPGSQWSASRLATLIGAVGQALADAGKLQTARARSGSMLRSQVATIRSEVDRQLITTNPKPDAILSSVSSAVAGWQQLMSGLSTQGAGLLQPVGVAGARPPANATDRLADQLSGYLDVLQGDLAAVKDVSASQGDLSKCTVASVTAPFVLIGGPAVKTFQPGESFTYQTEGGTTPLTVSLLGGLTAADLTATVSGTFVTAAAGKPAQARQGNLLITDATGRTLMLQIAVVATAAPAPPPPPQPAASASFSPPQLNLVRTVHANGHTPVPGLGDAKLDPDVVSWLQANKLVDAKGALSPAGYAAVVAQARKNIAAPPVGPELTASGDAVFTTFYSACGLPVPTGGDVNVPAKWFTPEFRLKLFDAQAKAAEPANFAKVTQKNLGSGFAITGHWDEATAKVAAAHLLSCSKS